MSIDLAKESLRGLTADKYRERDRKHLIVVRDIADRFTKSGGFNSPRAALAVAQAYAEEAARSREALVACVAEVAVAHIELVLDGKFEDVAADGVAIFSERADELAARLKEAPMVRRYAESAEYLSPFFDEVARSKGAIRARLDLVVRGVRSKTKYPGETNNVITVVGSNHVQAGIAGDRVSLTTGSSVNDLITALKELSDLVVSSKLADRDKRDLQDAISVATVEAAKPTPNKITINGVLSGIGRVAGTATELATVWGKLRQAASAWGYDIG